MIEPEKVCENCGNSYHGYGESSLVYSLRCMERDDISVQEDDTCPMFEHKLHYVMVKKIEKLEKEKEELKEKIRRMELRR
jgi:hypothetical protein